MSIEIGNHPDMPMGVMFHSTASGRFMPADRMEVLEMIAAIKRGELDGWAENQTSSVHVWWPDPDHVQATIAALEARVDDDRAALGPRADANAALGYWRRVQAEVIHS